MNSESALGRARRLASSLGGPILRLATTSPNSTTNCRAAAKRARRTVFSLVRNASARITPEAGPNMMLNSIIALKPIAKLLPAKTLLQRRRALLEELPVLRPVLGEEERVSFLHHLMCQPMRQEERDGQ